MDGPLYAEWALLRQRMGVPWLSRLARNWLMEQEITTLLATAAPRLFWGRAPQTAPARPYVVLSRISGAREYHMQGPDGLVSSRIQIDVYADTYIAAHNTGIAIAGALSGYRGGTIQGVFVDNQRDLTGIEGGDPNELFRLSIDVIVHHTSA